MDRAAVFVDAGYLFAQGSVELCGSKLTRGQMKLDPGAVVAALKAFADDATKLSLLRIYWYDGTSHGPSPQHVALAEQADVKVRLGSVDSFGQQKGVDSLIVTDMITLARNRAMAACVLFSGDEDLRVGIQQAQEYGVRVHLLGIKPARGTQSVFLLQEADATHEWDASDLEAFIACNRPVDPDPQSNDTEGLPLSPPAISEEDFARLEDVAQLVADSIPPAEIAALAASIRVTGQRPRDVDARLLAISGDRLDVPLTLAQKAYVREAFQRALDARLPEPEPSG